MLLKSWIIYCWRVNSDVDMIVTWSEFLWPSTGRAWKTHPIKQNILVTDLWKIMEGTNFLWPSSGRAWKTHPIKWNILVTYLWKIMEGTNSHYGLHWTSLSGTRRKDMICGSVDLWISIKMYNASKEELAKTISLYQSLSGQKLVELIESSNRYTINNIYLFMLWVIQLPFYK